MGFPEALSLAGAGIGAITGADAAGEAAKAEKDAAAKAAADAAQNLQDQAEERKRQMQLGGALIQLATYGAASQGTGSTMLANKLGKPGGA